MGRSGDPRARLSTGVVELMVERRSCLPERTRGVPLAAASAAPRRQDPVHRRRGARQPRARPRAGARRGPRGVPLDDGDRRARPCRARALSFAHDRVQTAYLLLSAGRRARAAHLRVGRLLRQNLDTGALDRQINLRSPATSTRAQRHRRPRRNASRSPPLNLCAGARESAAFESGLDYLDSGLHAACGRLAHAVPKLDLHLAAADAASRNGDGASACRPCSMPPGARARSARPRAASRSASRRTSRTNRFGAGWRSRATPSRVWAYIFPAAPGRLHRGRTAAHLPADPPHRAGGTAAPCPQRPSHACSPRRCPRHVRHRQVLQLRPAPAGGWCAVVESGAARPHRRQRPGPRWLRGGVLCGVLGAIDEGYRAGTARWHSHLEAASFAPGAPAHLCRLFGLLRAPLPRTALCKVLLDVASARHHRRRALLGGDPLEYAAYRPRCRGDLSTAVPLCRTISRGPRPGAWHGAAAQL